MAVLSFLFVVCLIGTVGAAGLFVRGKNLSVAQRENPVARLYGKIRANLSRRLRSFRRVSGIQIYGSGLFPMKAGRFLLCSAAL